MEGKPKEVKFYKVKETYEEIGKTADDMFLELGYKKEIIKSEVSNEINYSYEKPFLKEYNSGFINFKLIEKSIDVDHKIGIKELQAINKFCEERGWNE